MSGVVYSLFAGQGLVIVGVTGPVVIFCITVYNLSETFSIPYLPWLACVGVWAFLMHAALALSGSCKIISLVTPYACET